MRKVGVLEAKTRFSALLAEVERGETILVTRNGKEVALISKAGDRGSFQEALDRVKALKIRLGVPFKQLKEEGRR